MLSGVLFNKKISTCLLVLTVLFLPGVGLAFNMPPGIPQAWIEPDIAAPSPPLSWTSEQTGYYYVDNTVSCSDSNQYGWPGTPLCRPPRNLAAGDYVEIHGGPYNYTGTIYIRSYGTASEPVWIVGKDATMQMTLVLHGTYMYVDGLNIIGDKAIDIRPYNSVQTDHIMVRNITITGTGSLDTGKSGIAMYGATGLQVSGVIAYKNTISYMGDSEATIENDRHALMTGSYINDVWLLDNVTHHNGGDGVQFSHGGKDAHHFYYGRNVSHDERENCVDIKQADDVVISQNVCYNIERSSSSPGEGMVVHYDPNRIWFINNLIYNVDFGIISTGAFEVHVLGNVIHGIRESSTESHGDISTYRTGSAITGYSTGNMYIHNNTIYDAVLGVSYEALSGYECDITGNIISSLRSGATTSNNPYSIMIKGDDGTLANSDIEYNIFYDPVALYVDGATYTELNTLMSSGLKCDDGGGSCYAADPLLTSPPNDMTLQAGSPAIDASIEPSSLAAFYNAYGFNLEAVDIAGVARSTWDIGAYEYGTDSGGGTGGGGTTEPPPAEEPVPQINSILQK